MEEWRDIVGYEGIYQVSNIGRVKSLERVRCHGKKYKEKIKCGHLINGYVVVMLFKNGKHKHCKVHRLVAEAFIPNPKNKPCIDHIDTNRANNKVGNLRWVTYRENYYNPLSLKAQRGARARRSYKLNKS